MSKKNNKKAAKPAPKKNAKAAPKAVKKTAKPAAKKSAPKKAVKPVAKKAAKPIAKKAVKPALKKGSRPAKPLPKQNSKTKPQPKAAASKNNKPEVKKKSEKDVKKPLARKVEAPKKTVKPAAKPAQAKPRPAAKKEKAVTSKKDGKKSKKPGDAEMEGEEIDMEGGMLEIDPDAVATVPDDDDDDLLAGEPKEKRRRGRAPKATGRKHYDSEDFVRKQVVKIDLSKPLIKKPKREEPKPFVNNKDNRTRYSDKELNEFKEIIMTKLNEAKTDYDLLKQTLTNTDSHGTDDTSPTFKLLEDGSDMLSKEEVAQLAARQEKYIVSLQNALVRIQNKTYGICRVTGKLIPKERLRSVPHATLSIDAKLNQYEN